MWFLLRACGSLPQCIHLCRRILEQRSVELLQNKGGAITFQALSGRKLQCVPLRPVWADTSASGLQSLQSESPETPNGC